MSEITITPRKTRSKSGLLLPGLYNSKRSRKDSFDKYKLKRNLLEIMTDENRDMLDAMNLEQMRDEIMRLRELNNYQSNQLTRLREQIQENPRNDQNLGNLGDQLIQTLVDGLRAINVDAKVPKFNETDNPIEFLERMQKYFTLKNITRANCLNVFDCALEGRARAWFDAQRNGFVDYDDFKTKFLNEFYSIPIRVKIKSRWLANRFDHNRDNLQSYFLDQIKDARHFLPQMEPYEMYYTIIQQMPIRVREALATVDFSDFDRISQALAQLDLTFVDKISSQGKRGVSQPESQSNPESGKMKTKFRQMQLKQNHYKSCCNCIVANSQSGSYSDFGRELQAQTDRIRHTVPLPNLSIPPPNMTANSYRVSSGDSVNGQDHLNLY